MNYLFNDMDFLSPPITLFHLDRRTHTSQIGGILVILMLAISSIYISFLIYEHKKIASFIFYKKFEFEAGYYSFNSSSIFHFIQFYSKENGGFFDKYDSKYIRAYTTYAGSNASYENLYLYDHWVFDTCKENIHNKNLDSNLFNNIENFSNSVCIGYYYNSSEMKYYPLNDEGFSWPHLEHGIAQRNNVYLTTIIQKCSNDSVINKLFGQCPSQKDIDDYLNKYNGIYLYFVNTQIDPINYTNPIQKYLQFISSEMGTPQTFIENYIYFSPVILRTKIGSIFGKSNEINSFYFDFNRKGYAKNKEKYTTLAQYYYLMQNNFQIFERKYNNFFDTFPKIGGAIQFIIYIFYWINFLYNKYIIVYDTSSLLFSIRDNQHTINSIRNNKHIPKQNFNEQEMNRENFKENISRHIKSSKFFEKLKLDKINKDTKNHKKSNNDIINNLSKRKNNKLLKLNDEDKNRKIYFSNIISNKKIINDSLINLNNNSNIIIKIPSNKKKHKKYTNLNSSNFFLKENENTLLYDKIKRYSNNNNSYQNRQQIIKKYSNNDNSYQDRQQIKRYSNNNNSFQERHVLKRYSNNNSFQDMHKKFEYDKDKKKIKKVNKMDNKENAIKIGVSKDSISKIDHNKRNTNTYINENKSLTFFSFFKSKLLKKNKETFNFIKLFRNHLLSEEHLLKSHAKMMLLEKQHNFHGEECTNVLECFNEL